MPASATSIERELKEVEQRYWTAIQAADGPTVRELTGDTFTFAMKDGVMEFSRDDYVNMMVGGDFRLKKYAISEKASVYRSLGSDVAMSAHHGHWEFERAGKLEKRDTVTFAVWSREAGSWKCLAMSEVDAPNLPDTTRGGACGASSS